MPRILRCNDRHVGWRDTDSACCAYTPQRVCMRRALVDLAQVIWERGAHGPASNEEHGTASLPYFPDKTPSEKLIAQKKAEYAPFIGADGRRSPA